MASSIFELSLGSGWRQASIDDRCFGGIAEFTVGNTFCQFHHLEPALNDVEHAKVGDDPIDHALTSQRQGAAFSTLDSPGLPV